MGKRWGVAAILVVVFCACDSRNQNENTEANGSVTTGPGVVRSVESNRDSKTPASNNNYPNRDSETPASNNNYPNRRSHSLYIPSIGAYLYSIRFFEGPYNPQNLKQRQYRISFDRRTTRYIHWELNLTHKPPGQTVHYQIDSKWYRYVEMFFRQGINASIDPDWENSYQTHSYNMAPWIPGRYHVELSIGGLKLRSEYFDVYNADCSGGITLPGTDAVDDLRREVESSRYSGDNDEEASSRLAIALHNRGGQCFLNGNLDAAYQDFSEAIQIDSNFPLAYFHRGVVLLDLKRYKEALSDFETSIRDDQSSHVFAARARSHFYLEQDLEALQDLNRAIEKNPKVGEFYHNRGIVWYYLGEDQNSLSDLKKAASVYKSSNDESRYKEVSTAIDIVEGRVQGYLRLYDVAREFYTAELK